MGVFVNWEMWTHKCTHMVKLLLNQAPTGYNSNLSAPLITPYHRNQASISSGIFQFSFLSLFPCRNIPHLIPYFQTTLFSPLCGVLSHAWAHILWLKSDTVRSKCVIYPSTVKWGPNVKSEKRIGISTCTQA